jgi:imidazolonepropionase-like amidohydrolase
MAGGGVSSPHDPIESTQFTEEEIRPAVEAAPDWGTYVTVHVYTPAAIQRAVNAGVKCIEHGQLIDEPTAKDQSVCCLLILVKKLWRSPP